MLPQEVTNRQQIDLSCPPVGAYIPREGPLVQTALRCGAGSLLKEAVEDLEWVFAGMAEKGVMTLAIQRAPPCITVSANSTGGSLEVKLPVSPWAGDLLAGACARGRSTEIQLCSLAPQSAI